jgi:hypothetical protein
MEIFAFGLRFIPSRDLVIRLYVGFGLVVRSIGQFDPQIVTTVYKSL